MHAELKYHLTTTHMATSESCEACVLHIVHVYLIAFPHTVEMSAGDHNGAYIDARQSSCTKHTHYVGAIIFTLIQ